MTDLSPLEPSEAFAELGRISLADHSLDLVMDRIATLARRTLPGAAAVSVTLVEAGTARTVAHDGDVALRLDERQYERGYGPCLDSVAAGTMVAIDSMSAEDRWPDFTQDARREGVGSSMSVPVPIQREVGAALNIYGVAEGAFDDAAKELAATFSAYAGVALANIHLYEAQARVADQLQTAMQSRAVIEQAKGILMGERRCSADEAFDVLVRLSQETNRKLRDVAQVLVDRAGGPDRSP